MEEFNPQAMMLNSSIQKTAKDMNFVGIVTIIQGVVTCLTIIGAIFGIPYIIMGLRLREASKEFINFTMVSDTATLHRAIEKQGSYFFIMKVLMIIGIVVMVLYFVFFAAIFGTLMSKIGGHSSTGF